MPGDAPVDLLADAPWHIAVDFDGVLFDQARHVRAVFQDLHGIELGPPHEWPWDLTEHPLVSQAGLTKEDTWKVFHRVHNDPTLHETDPLDREAVAVLQRLIDAGHHVDVVTARSSESIDPTRSFLERNRIPHRELTMDANDKTGYDVLIDDLPQQVSKAAEDGSLALLMDQPYNRGYEAMDNPYRVDGFAHVGSMLEATVEPA